MAELPKDEDPQAVARLLFMGGPGVALGYGFGRDLRGESRRGSITPTHEEEIMYTLIKSISLRDLFTEQIPALGASFIIAELFYKFHSFTLECLAFLATWFLADAAISGALNLWRKPAERSVNKSP